MPISKEQHLISIKRDINQAKRTGLLSDTILLTKGCCDECEKINGKRMSLDEVIRTKPLPYYKCTKEPSCICCYTFQPLRDNNGRLIRVKKSWWKRIFH